MREGPDRRVQPRAKYGPEEEIVPNSAQPPLADAVRAAASGLDVLEHLVRVDSVERKRNVLMRLTLEPVAPYLRASRALEGR
ncbi:MAG TPA: hypothetical protein VF188_15415 [Longimicrobiales bacterium]